MKVRSTLAESIESYYAALLGKIDQSPWAGRRASDLAIPVRVLKESAVLREPLPGYEKGQQTPSKEECYVDRELARVYEESGRKSTPVRWETERERIDRCVVIGPPGGGKTFLTVMTAIDLARQGLAELVERSRDLDSLPLPFWFELKTLWEDPTRDPARSLVVMLRAIYSGQLPSGDWLSAQFTKRNCWLILDGLDELERAQARQLRTFLEAIQVAGWQCRLLLTCRTADYNASAIPWSRVAEFELAPLEGTEPGDLIRRWYGDDPRGDSLEQLVNRSFSLRHACRSPLLVALACATHEDRELSEEATRRDLYRLALDGLLWQRWKKDGPGQGLADELRLDDLNRLLPELAWKLFIETPRNVFLNERVVDALAEVNEDGKMSGGATTIRDYLVHSGLLRAAGPDALGRPQLSFLHRTFLEFLSAEWLLAAVKRHGWAKATVQWTDGLRPVYLRVRKMAWLAEWREVIVLLTAGGDSKGIDSVMNWLLKDEKDDMHCHRLTVAAFCLNEVPIRLHDQCETWINFVTTKVWDRRWGYEWIYLRDHLDAAWAIVGRLNGQVRRIRLVERLIRPIKARISWNGGDGFGHRPPKVPFSVEELVHIAPQTMPELRRLFNDDADFWLRENMAVALGEKALQYPEVPAVLLKCLGQNCANVSPASRSSV